jgi:hypothetical protein
MPLKTVLSATAASALAIMLAIAPSAMLTATAASASESSSGHVVSYSEGSRLLRLSNGKTYVLPTNFDRTGLAEGVAVSIDWVDSGARRVVREISLH